MKAEDASETSVPMYKVAPYPKPHSVCDNDIHCCGDRTALPLLIQCEVTFKTGRLLVLQWAVPCTGGSIHVNRREHT
jgi:hypothetical protein